MGDAPSETAASSGSSAGAGAARTLASFGSVFKQALTQTQAGLQQAAVSTQAGLQQAVSTAQAGLQAVGTQVAAVTVEPLKSAVTGGGGRGSAQRSERELGACGGCLFPLLRGRAPPPPPSIPPCTSPPLAAHRFRELKRSADAVGTNLMAKEVGYSRSSSEAHARVLREVEAMKSDVAAVDAVEVAGLARHICGARVTAAAWVGRE